MKRKRAFSCWKLELTLYAWLLQHFLTTKRDNDIRWRASGRQILAHEPALRLCTKESTVSGVIATNRRRFLLWRRRWMEKSHTQAHVVYIVQSLYPNLSCQRRTTRATARLAHAENSAQRSRILQPSEYSSSASAVSLNIPQKLHA